MKAYVLHGIHDLRLEQVQRPELKEGEVLVEVKAAGICGSDIPRIYRTGAYSHPLIPGHEFSGVVAAVGKGADERWKGMRVGIFPLIPCGSCIPCQKKQYEMCRHYSYLGSRRDGGFGEFAAVPEANLVPLPDSVSFQEAAMLEPMAVAAHAMRRLTLKTEDRIVVCGLGTIGLLLIMFLQEAGYNHILAVGNKEFQRQAVLKLGVDQADYYDGAGTGFIKGKTELREGEGKAQESRPNIQGKELGQWIMERTGGAGADVFFECVGKNETISSAVDYTAPGGQVMLVGNPYSDMKLEKAVYWKILRNQLTLTGTWNSSFDYGAYSVDGGKSLSTEMKETDDWQYVLERLAWKRIAPAGLITHCFPFEELEKGFAIMRDKAEDYIKVMGVAPLHGER